MLYRCISNFVRGLCGTSIVAVRSALGISLVFMLAAPVTHAATVLMQEDFEGITGFGGGWDPQLFGVPTTDGSTDASSTTIGDADNDWFGARFEAHDNGATWQDVGSQAIGGGSNPSQVGLVEDDAVTSLRTKRVDQFLRESRHVVLRCVGQSDCGSTKAARSMFAPVVLPVVSTYPTL